MNSVTDIEEKLYILSKKYAAALKAQTDQRVLDMLEDDISHRLIYRVLGINNQEGQLIDLYQNKGRFLYKYAGSFLEEAARLCFLSAFSDATAFKIPNSLGTKPATFQIDCLINGRDAIEIKWRDATTDGDHITKEHTRIKAIAAAGYTPIRIMFYYPNRLQAKKIQETLQTLYAGLNGQYYFGDSAWQYIIEKTGINLKEILEHIANTNIGAENDLDGLSG